jgi:hypothetical protein
MISELTAAQEKEKVRIREEYRNIGTDTGVVNRSVTEEIDEIYKEMKKKSPTYVWVDNPWEANVIINVLQSTLDKSDPELITELERQIDDGELLNEGLIKELSTKVKKSQHESIDGSIDAYWICFIKFGEQIGVEYDANDLRLVNVWDRLIRKTGFWYPFEDVCIVCNRPKEIHFNDSYELHNEKGPAVCFRRSGVEVFSINGVTVPKEVVMEPENITVESIDKEESLEVKRIMMDQMGIGKYLYESGAKLIDGDMTFVSKEEEGKSVPRALMEDKEGRRFLVGTDGSRTATGNGVGGRIYHMQVDQSINTCSEAASALAGFDESNIIASS